MTAATFGRVAGQLRLAFDHRGDDQQLIGGDVQLARARDLAAAEVFGERVSCSCTSRPAGVAAVEFVGGREQEPFEVGGAGRRAVVGRVRAAASAWTPSGSCRSDPAAWARAAICRRVSPSGISTRTTTGAATGLGEAVCGEPVDRQPHRDRDEHERHHGQHPRERRAPVARRDGRDSRRRRGRDELTRGDRPRLDLRRLRHGRRPRRLGRNIDRLDRFDRLCGRLELARGLGRNRWHRRVENRRDRRRQRRLRSVFGNAPRFALGAIALAFLLGPAMNPGAAWRAASSRACGRPRGSPRRRGASPDPGGRCGW